ncbi:MAG TPA: S-layer homology domain-containing protein, partial [Chloroflexia bacterium]
MSSQPVNRNRMGATMLLLALFFGAVLTASVAIAGVPANQGKGQLPPKQPEHPSKGSEKPAPPNAINIRGGVQSSVQEPFGGGACGPGSIQFDAEPNNTITNSQMLSDTFDSEIRGFIDYGGDVDYFAFTANAGDRVWAYAFTLGAVSSTDTQLQLYNAMSQTVQFDDDNGSQADLSSALAGAVITQTGTYYLRLNAFSSTATIQGAGYRLFLDRTSTAAVGEIEPNNTFTQTNPYIMDSVVTGTIPITTDLDVYAFEFLDDDRYVFHVDGDPERDGTEFNPNFDLMNASGAVLVTVDSDSQFDVREINSENAAFFIDTGGPPTSTLLLRVRADGESTGSYSLHIWRVGETVCGNTPTPTNTPTATPVCNTFISEVEPNSTITNSQMLPTLNNLEVRAPVNPAGDVDYFNGNATAGQKVWAYVYTGQSTSGADSEMRLLDAMSNTIQYDDDNGSQTAASSGIAGAPITTSGTIHFRINEFNNDGTITPYLLFVDLTSSTPNVTEVEVNDTYTQATMVTVGDLITGSIPISTDLDVYGFTVNAGDRIIFQADGDPERDGVQYNPNFQILDSTGAQLIAVDSDSTLGDKRSEHHAFTFGSAGTYYVRMSADVSGPDSGTYNLHLWRTGNPPCSSPTPMATNTSTMTPTFTATATPTRTGTPTNTAVPPSATPDPTAVPPTSTGTVTAVASATSTICSTAVNLVLDDGTVENSVGWTNSTQSFAAIWINRSSPPAASFPMNLTQISIKWPNDSTLVGKTIALLVYSDVDGDGDPADAVKVAQVNGQTITVADATTFQNYPVNINITGPGDVYYGFSDTYNNGGVSPRTFPSPLDTNASQGRSFVAAQDDSSSPDYDNLSNNDNLGTIDSLSGGAYTGNWVIRATGTGGSCPTGTATTTGTSVPATNTSTAVASSTVVGATSTPMATATVCTVNFPDNQPGDTFYEYIQCLACRGIVTGYPDGMFHAERNITRGQISKMVSNAAGFNEDPGPQIYQDV